MNYRAYLFKLPGKPK